MKVISRQRNSRFCMVCGLDNPFGIRGAFYSMEDGSVMSPFRFHYNHQSYPGRVHGGMVTTVLDELGVRALWAKNLDETLFGVTTSLTTKYRRPAPYETDLVSVGRIISETSRFFIVDAKLYDTNGVLYADSELKYIKLAPEVISDGVDVHEQMPYLIEDGVKELPFDFILKK